MTGSPLEVRIAAVIAETFEVDAATVNAQSAPATIPNWDSLGHLNLVTALEKAFGIAFTMDEILAMSDAGAILKMLSGRGGEVSP